MSRGPGRWQRAILDALERSEWVALRDLTAPALEAWDNAMNEAVSTGAHVTEYLAEAESLTNACERAARTLATSSAITLYTFAEWAIGRKLGSRLVAARKDAEAPRGKRYRKR